MLFSDSVYLLSLEPSRTFCYRKFYPLAIFQRTIATALDGTVMNEDVATCVPFNKAITLVIIEPLNSTYFTFCHGYQPPKIEQGNFRYSMELPIKT
jgi:hypothetical protein